MNARTWAVVIGSLAAAAIVGCKGGSGAGGRPRGGSGIGGGPTIQGGRRITAPPRTWGESGGTLGEPHSRRLPAGYSIRNASPGREANQIRNSQSDSDVSNEPYADVSCG